ncbi:MAG: tRNA (N6-threonylcarbamoyladenosine(37)-N6)-methyltransferase TrmO [Fibrobacter sp.]|nr:tRNA (N6-threonylcarbamoyladenosine(37)-N6)-methyltransferase TrmO [Fibrobacter sp.]
MEPIGTFYSQASYKYEVPRQGIFFRGHPGRIELLPHKGFEEALRDLEGFERLWVLFHFHQNSGWRPTTRPPVPPADHDRVGTFASRSPYRPNPIGLSCVKLLSVEKLTLHLDEADLLNGTPIFDIKPYIPSADAFPAVKAGWVDGQNSDLWKIIPSSRFQKENDWIFEMCGWDLQSFAECQLANSPLDASRRRVKVHLENHTAELAFRTFRIDFDFDEASKQILLKEIRSGYSSEELASSEDVYHDKDLHRDFLQQNF